MLIALISLAFAAVFDAVPFSGFGMMTRFVAAVVGARAIRTVAFMLTVLPAMYPGCYAHRFPPVPDTAAEFLRIGFGRMRAGGGCNDLVLSGHVIICAAVCCAFSEFAPGVASKLLWGALARGALRDAVELRPGSRAHHYSVDMWLGTVVTALTWRAAEGVYPAAASRLARRPVGAPPDPRGALAWALTAAVFAVLGVLVVIVVGGGA